MSLDLDAIKARADAATREPWHVEYFGDAGYPQRIANEAASIVADLHEGGGYPAHNAEFIAAARTDVPALVAEVERKRMELRDAHNDLLDVRGILSPNGYEPKTPLPLAPTVAPAVAWLVAEVERLRAAVAGVRVLAEQADKFGLCLDDGKALREALDGVS